MVINLLKAAALFSFVMFLTESAAAQSMAFGSTGEPIQAGNSRFFDPGAVIGIEEDSTTANVNGNNVDVNVAEKMYTGYFVPDGNGGVIFMPGKTMKAPNVRFIEAREIKLKVRELADQLTANLPESVKCGTFLPVTFVSQDNFDSTSSFGRYIAEQLYFEFNQRGMKVQEYRLASKITMTEGFGETALTRKQQPKSIRSANDILAVGTYFSTRDAVMLNARLVRGSDKMVLSSANMVFKQTRLSRQMLAKRSVKPGDIRIKAFPRPAPVAPTTINPFDAGQDIH